MIPVKLKIRNFMPYRDNVPPLSFGGIHTACISGDNGNGKSALIDAMTHTDDTVDGTDDASGAYQEVSLTTWASAISAGNAQLQAGGYMMCEEYEPREDKIRLRIIFYNSGDSPIETWDTGWMTGVDSWTYYGITDHDIPTEAAKVRIWSQWYEIDWGAGACDNMNCEIKVYTPPPSEPPPPSEGEAVGGNVFAINKVALVAPWIALAAVIVAVGIILVRRRAHSQK